MCGDTKARNRDETHQRPVTDEQTGGNCEECPGALCREADEPGDKVADRNPSEDTKDSEMGVVEVWVETEEEIEREDDSTAPEDVHGEGSPAFSPSNAGLEREDDGGADEEQEVGEDDVSEGEPVPIGVVELCVGLGPVAGVVDEDHEADGEATKYVDGEDACRDCCSGSGLTLHGEHDRSWRRELWGLCLREHKRAAGV